MIGQGLTDIDSLCLSVRDRESLNKRRVTQQPIMHTRKSG